MSFKTVLVPVSSPDASKSTLETALLVARRWNSHLEILHDFNPGALFDLFHRVRLLIELQLLGVLAPFGCSVLPGVVARLLC